MPPIITPYAVVGTIPAVTQGGTGAAITPAYGTGTRKGGNLLILWVAGTGAATLPTTPAGWSIGKQVAGTSCSATIYYKIATGGDAQPTVALVASTVLSGQLAEFAGGAGGVPVDQSGSGTGTTSPVVSTNGAADKNVGELFVYAAALFFSVARTPTITPTLTNAVAVDTTNAATSSVNHYDFGYGITTARASADSDSMAYTTTSITGVAEVTASFKLWSPQPTIVQQAMQRASYY